MKAINIIHEMTVFNYADISGIITVPAGGDPWHVFNDAFGMGWATIYASSRIVSTVKREKNFFYVEDERFPCRDKELFAILTNGDNKFLYIYEID